MYMYNSKPTTITALYTTNTHSIFDLKLEPQKTCLKLGIGWNQHFPGCSQATGIQACGEKMIEALLQEVEAK